MKAKVTVSSYNQGVIVNSCGNKDEDSKTVDVHCKSAFPFLPQMPELDNYLRGELNDFFRAHHLVGNEMAKLRDKE